MNIRLIRAFMASPGGLDIERSIAFGVAEEVNRSVAVPMDGRLELIGWEETLSGVGRPQAIINAEMETCDLFIGAMSTRWGSSPSVGGVYTSGFEEEFELSRDRHTRTKSPVMAMYFKEIDPLQRSDPGEELAKVLLFQEKLRDEKQFLYGTFSSPEDFAARIRQFLSINVIKLLRLSGSPREERPVSVEHDGALSTAENYRSPGEKAPDVGFLLAAAELMRADDGLSGAEVARLRLIANVSGGHSNDREILGVHDANLIYHHIKQQELTVREKIGLLSAGLVGIENHNVPVWSWVLALKKFNYEVLFTMTIVGEEAERVGALKAIRRLKLPVQKFEFLDGKSIEELWFQPDAPSAVKVEALRYIREMELIGQLPLVKAEAEFAAKETVQTAIETVVALMVRVDGADAVRYILSISFENIDASLLRDALTHIDQISAQDLLSGLDHRSSDVRAATLAELSERSMVDLPTLERAKEDESSKVRLAALHALDRIDQRPSLDEAYTIMEKSVTATGLLSALGQSDHEGTKLFETYRTERLRSTPVAQLERLLAIPSYREPAYFALAARKLLNFHEKLRSDLADGFQSYVKRYWPNGIPKPRSNLWMLSGGGEASSIELKQRELTRLGVEVIANEKDHGDLELIRMCLEMPGIVPMGSVINYLKNFGGERDVNTLAKASRFSVWNEAGRRSVLSFDLAALAILKLSTDIFATTLDRNIPTNMRVRLIQLSTAAEFSKVPDDIVISLLLDDDSSLRSAAVRKIPVSMSRRRIRKLLSTYTSKPEGKYYEVIHWLDLGIAYDRVTARKVLSVSN